MFFTLNQQIIAKGLNLNSQENINLLYTTANLYDLRSNTSNFISDIATSITLASKSQASVGEILHIGNELMLVVAQDDKNFDVERGYLNTQKKNHAIGTSVRAIPRYSKKDIQSSFAYAVIRSEVDSNIKLLWSRTLC